VVVFLRVSAARSPRRRFGARELAYADPGPHSVAVSHAPREATGSWCAVVTAQRAPSMWSSTKDRGPYGARRLGRTSLGHFRGRRSLTAVARLAREGIRNRHPAGTRWQSAGTFAVDAAGPFATCPSRAATSSTSRP
jgi:hypothetical protein